MSARKIAKKIEKEQVKPKKTVGEHSLELQQKHEPINVIDLQREVMAGTNSKKSYEETLWDTVDSGKKDPKIEKDFFIVALTKAERVMKNVFRNMFFYRQSCPTPQYDQSVWKYHKKDDELEYLWTVPSKQYTHLLPHLIDELPPEQKRLVYMIDAFVKGDLDRLAEKLNKEELNTNR